MDENVCDVCECQGQFCGGIAGFQCPEGEVCEFEGDYPETARPERHASSWLDLHPVPPRVGGLRHGRFDVRRWVLPGAGGIGKADLVGSCELQNGTELCGGKGAGNCWCDDACLDYGDCCSDAGDVCGLGGDDTGEVCGEVLCALYCEHGFKVDENGCDVCECQGQFCGGIAGFQCPEGQVCVFEGDYPDAGGYCEPDPGCTPDLCGPAPLFENLCPDAETVIDAVCEEQDDGSCGWTIPSCPPPPPGGSCEDACGGQSAGCWCDDLCEGYGDCCDDYGEWCGPEPTTECGDLECGAGETCVIHVTQVGLQHACVTIPDACDGEASCDCMGDAVCTGVFDSCGTGENNDLYCSCPVC